MPSVYIAPSIYRAIDPRTMTAIMSALIQSNAEHDRVIWEPMWNDALIARSRSMLVTNFLENHPDADVMVIIDDDVVFEPDDFWKIVEGARETRSIYGGAYVTRSVSPHLSSSFWPADGGELIFRATPERRPIELEYLSTGFWAVHRDVVEAMAKPGQEFQDANGTHQLFRVSRGANQEFVPFFYPFVIEEAEGKYHYLSEDWAFGQRARQLGFKSYCDLSIILVHMGLYPYSVKDINTVEAEAMTGLPSTGTDYLEFDSGPNEHGDPLLDDLTRDVADFMEESLGDTRRRMQLGPQYLFDLWAQRTEPEAEWYRREDVGLAYINDIAQWHQHRSGSPVETTPELFAGLRGLRVLDYGAGIGTSALAAARAGAEVIAYEPNPTMREFIAFRAIRHGIDILVADLPPMIFSDVDRFDRIICWHVFEHLAEPEKAVTWIAGALRPAGALLSDSGFDDQDTPLHHDHPNWSGVLAAAGFTSDGAVHRLSREAVPA